MINPVNFIKSEADRNDSLRVEAIQAIDSWFNYRKKEIGLFTIDEIYTSILALPSITAYLYNHSEHITQKTRRWSIQTQITLHIRHFVMNMEEK